MTLLICKIDKKKIPFQKSTFLFLTNFVYCLWLLTLMLGFLLFSETEEQNMF